MNLQIIEEYKGQSDWSLKSESSNFKAINKSHRKQNSDIKTNEFYNMQIKDKDKNTLSL